MTVSADSWRRLLDGLDGPPSFGELACALADARDLPRDRAAALVDDALQAGPLVEDSDAGIYGTVRLVDTDEMAENTPQEGDSPDANPGGNADETPSNGAREAFVDTIAFFHAQLDRDLPSEDAPATPREYYRDVRGWEPDTIDDAMLGWAPASDTALLDHLMREGYDREAILGTGLFWADGLDPIWQGRYVLPYFDVEGRPAFAISRRAGEDGHPADRAGDYGDGPAKYHKIPVSREHVDVAEPIYGLDTVREGEPVLITEGIADAITAHQAGYPCVSPVTTTFKQSDHERLAEALEERDVSRAYIVQDAERPGSSVDEEGNLMLPEHGEGVRGAVATAEHLTEHDVDARIGTLPRPGLDKVDLDDHLQTWNDDLTPILASAVPVDQHPAHDPKRAALEAADRSRPDRDHTGGGSALFELDIRDVTGLPWDYRGTNPLGHHGESENYYVLLEERGLGYDHKYKAAYNALTHLLVEAGEREPADPNGPLDDEELLAAWVRAKRKGYIPDDDPIPHRALRYVALERGLADRDELGDGWKLPDEAYNAALDVVREEYGVDPGRDPIAEYEPAEADAEEYVRDPREVEATVDPRRAWDAAGRVTPEDLDADLPELEAVGDVARAVAIAEGMIDDPEEPLTDEYPEAYRRAREAYGAPLPEYYTTADAIAEFDAVLDVIGEVTFWHLDTDALESEITAENSDVDGDAVRALDPAWRDSESGESVLVFDSGTVWDADTERVLDALRFVALDTGLIDDPGDPLAGETFTTAYDRARRVYGAPLPRWDPATDGAREVTPQLPSSEALVEQTDLDGVDKDALDAARDDVEALLADAVEDDGPPTVVTSLPATGKTTGAVKIARETPLSYLAPRKELQQQALKTAKEYGVDAELLPVFSEARVRDEVLDAAVSHVRDQGKGRLRDRWAILAAAQEAADSPDSDGSDGSDGSDDGLDAGDIFTDGNEEGVDLDRATCDTAEGEHGVAWALVVHVARRLGYTPREIHENAAGLFGVRPPCCNGEGDCSYGEGWDAVTDPDDPPDLLIGAYVHAHVESVRTAYDRPPTGDITRDPRPVVLDEYPGEAFVAEHDEQAVDFATWLARCLREDVADKRDMHTADLGGDPLVGAWLDGRAGEADDAVADAIDALGRTADLLEAREEGIALLAEVEAGLLEDLGVADALDRVTDPEADAAATYRDLRDALDAVPHEHPAYGVAGWIDDDIREPLARATVEGATTPSTETNAEELPVDHDLAALVERAVEAAREGRDDARAALEAATSALEGGEAGCRRLAAWAEDGYAHPDAHHFLTAVITPTGEGKPGDRVHTDKWAFDEEATDGTVVDAVETSDRDRVVLDRNDHGALLQTPPARTSGGGEDVPLVGLDATGRAELWGEALNEPVATADIHDTPRERAAFLEDALGLRVLQASDLPRPYEGDPTSKDTDGDAALLEAIDDEYAGVEAPRQRGEEASPVGSPAAITTKGVRERLEADSRLEDVVAEWENFGNLTGANDLGKHRLGAILGSQHYGDDAVERFAALAGEEVDTDRAGGRGADLDYGNDLANAYLGHMREDQVMQAILRFTRGESGATVVARTSALREDLPVVGEGQIVETWSDTATEIARAYRRHGGRFTIADVCDAVDVCRRQVRRILNELADAGYIRVLEQRPGVATEYQPVGAPGAGEVTLPERADAVEGEPGQEPHNQSYTWNVRVFGGEPPPERAAARSPARQPGAPPSPSTVAGGDRPPDPGD